MVCLLRIAASDSFLGSCTARWRAGRGCWKDINGLTCSATPLLFNGILGLSRSQRHLRQKADLVEILSSAPSKVNRAAHPRQCQATSLVAWVWVHAPGQCARWTSKTKLTPPCYAVVPKAGAMGELVLEVKWSGKCYNVIAQVIAGLRSCMRGFIRSIRCVLFRCTAAGVAGGPGEADLGRADR